jgi:putative oxidoreductase
VTFQLAEFRKGLSTYPSESEDVCKLQSPGNSSPGPLADEFIYLTSGIAKLTDWSGNITYMSRHHLPMVPVLLALAALIELLGSICLVTGYQARWAALVMFGYTAILTVMLHNYWAYTGDAAGMQETHFRKNVAIMGGLLMLVFSGPGELSLQKRKSGGVEAGGGGADTRL